MTIDFDELSYDRMIVNVMSVPIGKSPQDSYEVLQKYDEFYISPEFWTSHPGLKKEKVFRYFPLVYDKNSPLKDVIENIKQIKGKAAELAGFKKNESGKYNEDVEALMSCQLTEINKMFIRYITLHKSALYHRYAILSEVYDNLSEKLLRTQDTKDVKTFDETGDKLDTIKQDLLSGDNSKKLEDDLNEYYFADRLALRPEDIAAKRQEGVALT